MQVFTGVRHCYATSSRSATALDPPRTARLHPKAAIFCNKPGHGFGESSHARGWGWRLLVLHVLLGGGCVSQAMYQAKVDELERLRADGRRGEQLLVERIDRMSARIGDLEKQFVQSDTRLVELSRSMQQVETWRCSSISGLRCWAIASCATIPALAMPIGLSRA